MDQRVRRRQDDHGATGPANQHCHIVETGNNSHRYNQSSVAAKLRIKEREQSHKKAKAAPPNEPF